MIRSLFALALAAGLTACQGSETAPDAPTAGQDGKPGMAVAEARLVLPAVKGNPGAVYFNVFNGSDKNVSLVAVAIDGAGKAELHDSKRGEMAKLDSVAIKPTWTQRLIPGSRHVMAFDLDPKLVAGGETEMTLTFDDGDKLSAPLRIEAMGMDMEHDH